MPRSSRPPGSARSWCGSRSVSKAPRTSSTISDRRCAPRKGPDTMQLSVNGSDVFVATGGRPFDPSLPAVVMIHGAGFDHSTWALHSRWFAHHGFSVLVPDLPGHGRSGGKALPTIADMADWTAALLDAAKAPKARLVGHSMGSLIALETAARHPGKVAGLSLIGTAATMTVGPDLLKAAE